MADIKKIMGIDKSNLSKFMGGDIPSAGGGDRGVFGGGNVITNIIDYVTINSAGNATDFCWCLRNR